MQFNKFFDELKRRNIFRVATAYAIAGWLIIQICTATFPYLNLPDWLITAVIIFVAIGFPIAIIFAWAFEITPEGIKKSREVQKDESITSQTGKKINRVIITVLSVAVFFLIIERVFFARASILEGEQANIENASIAVLPFVNMSSDPENEYFSDGLSEELLNALAKVENMKVAGRTSSFKFKGQNENLSMIAEELGVAYILEGSVRKSGNRVRITAQLIKADDGYHMWSDAYDRELNDIFAIQQEISRTVLNELKVHLLPNDETELEAIPTTDVEAYQAYLKANQLVVNRDIDEINVAIELYLNAIRLDPTFAEAYARLSIAYDLQGYYGNIPFEEEMANVKEYAEAALAMDDNLAEAHAAMGLYYGGIQEFEQAKEYYIKSLELNPNLTDAYNWLGNLYIDDLREPDLGFEQFKKMYEVDPLAPLSIYNRARASIFDDKDDEARELYQKNQRINPEFIPTYLGLAFLESNSPRSRFDESFINVHKAYKLDNNFVRSINIMVTRAVDLNLEPVAKHYLDILKQNYPESPEYLNRTGTYASLSGDYSYVEEDALPFIERTGFVPQDGGFYYDVVDLYVKKGTPEESLKWFIKYDEELVNGEKESLSVQTAFPALALAYYYQKTEQNEKADRLIEQFCELAESLKDNEDFGPDSDLYFYGTMRCHIEKRDLDTALPYVKEMIEERRDIGGMYSWLNESEGVLTEMMDRPDYREFLEPAFEELETQRANLIEYLKDEGVWKEEWGGGN